MNKINEMTQAHDSNAAGYARAYLDYLSSLFRAVDCDAVGAFVELLLSARQTGNAVFFIGNGGLGGDCIAFANDISVGTRTGDNKPFNAVSLTDNVAR